VAASGDSETRKLCPQLESCQITLTHARCLFSPHSSFLLGSKSSEGGHRPLSILYVQDVIHLQSPSLQFIWDDMQGHDVEMLHRQLLLLISAETLRYTAVVGFLARSRTLKWKFFRLLLQE